MGVPKFFRFISDRYPCINKIVKEHEIPSYDNLYLDMNSIIHTCSHPTDSDVHFRIGKKEYSDEDIFQNVSRYVELIFQIVKPANLMFLAFDGVAPRAKMNQQRSNRFRMGKNINKLVIEENFQKGDDLFDANCITPGTLFMSELIDHIKHFIAYKISNHVQWQKCKIILSGSEVPGEGEHKIMEFIRYNKAQPGFNPNTRHCLYSLDADLIMLGLCTHEPHFSLLRENTIFGKKRKMLTPEESDFDLLHLSIFREYLSHEFSTLKSELNFDLEKIIDDWILIQFLVGNDFVPQLPHLNIVTGALSLLYKNYIKVFSSLEGYINEAGTLNLPRFKKFVSTLSKLEHIEVHDFKKSNELCYNARKEINVENIFKNLSINYKEKDIENSSCSKELLHSESNSTDESKSRNSNFKIIKKNYYKNKFKINEIDDEYVQHVVNNYIKGIQWTLSYYYEGCCSWSWHYPYHYAPLISDVENFSEVNLKFDIGKPLLPLQHLLAVLPPTNAHLLPESLRYLVTSIKSPIIDFYPEEFEIDLNGKSNDWEAVVLIPFISEKRLITAMEPCIKSLSIKERKRNVNGVTCTFVYTKSSLGQYPVDTIFDSFENHAQLEYIKAENLFVPKEMFVKGLCSNVNLNMNHQSFPTLKYVPHSVRFELTKSKYDKIAILKNETMILHVSPQQIPNINEISKKLLGQVVYINWPYLKEAYVIGVTDFKDRIFLKEFWKKLNTHNLKQEKLSDSEISKMNKEKLIVTEIYKKNLGIDIGETNIFLYVFPVLGKRYASGKMGDVILQSKWSSLSETFPYQIVVKKNNLPNVTSTLYKSIEDIFVSSSFCFMIGHPNYGSIAEVKNVNFKQQRVNAAFKITVEPDFTLSNENFFAADISYISGELVAQKLKIKSILISRLTGSIIVTENADQYNSKFYDIGLRMKFPKQNKELSGYMKKKSDSWFYSNDAVELIKAYINKFPDIIEYINKNSTLATFKITELFPKGFSQLQLVQTWLGEQQTSYKIFLECNTKTLGMDGIPKVEKFVSEFLSKQEETKIIEKEVSVQMLYRPGTILGIVPPDTKVKNKLLDRIVCTRENFTVPLGFKGTIIGIQEKTVKWKNIFEILFDHPFTGGLTLYESSENKIYRLTVSDFINISYGQRESRNQSNNKESKNGSDKEIKSNTKAANNHIPLIDKTEKSMDKATGEGLTLPKLVEVKSTANNLSTKKKRAFKPRQNRSGRPVKKANEGSNNDVSLRKDDKSKAQTTSADNTQKRGFNKLRRSKNGQPGKNTDKESKKETNLPKLDEVKVEELKEEINLSKIDVVKIETSNNTNQMQKSNLKLKQNVTTQHNKNSSAKNDSKNKKRNSLRNFNKAKKRPCKPKPDEKKDK